MTTIGIREGNFCFVSKCLTNGDWLKISIFDKINPKLVEV